MRPVRGRRISFEGVCAPAWECRVSQRLTLHATTAHPFVAFRRLGPHRQGHVNSARAASSRQQNPLSHLHPCAAWPILHQRHAGCFFYDIYCLLVFYDIHAKRVCFSLVSLTHLTIHTFPHTHSARRRLGKKIRKDLVGNTLPCRPTRLPTRSCPLLCCGLIDCFRMGAARFPTKAAILGQHIRRHYSSSPPTSRSNRAPIRPSV